MIDGHDPSPAVKEIAPLLRGHFHPAPLPESPRDLLARSVRCLLAAGMTWKEIRYEVVLAARAEFGWSHTQAARSLGIGRATLYRWEDVANDLSAARQRGAGLTGR